MHLLLWLFIYIVMTIFLLYVFFKEKKVINSIRGMEDKFLINIYNKGNTILDNKLFKNTVYAVSLIITVIFYFLVDKTQDRLVPIKLYGIYGIFIINVFFYLIKKEHEIIFISNLLMLFLGKYMFNIHDNIFYIYLVINIGISLLSVFIFKNNPDTTITKDILIEEDRKNNAPFRNINEETVYIERRRRTTLGRALLRINNSLLAIILVGLLQMFYIGNYVIPSGSMEPTIQIKDRVFANMIKYHFTSPKVGEIIAFKEPVNDRVMYTKRITGQPGTTLQIISGRILENDIESTVLDRSYEPEGLFSSNKIYIPKKGDVVYLDKIIILPKLTGYTDDNIFVSTPNWNGLDDGQYEEMTGTEFLQTIQEEKGFDKIIGNDSDYSDTDVTKQYYYTFLLKAEGHDEIVMPIMEFKYDDKLFMNLLKGAKIELKDDYYMAMGDNTRNSYDSRYFGLVSKSRIKGELIFRWWPINRMGLL